MDREITRSSNLSLTEALVDLRRQLTSAMAAAESDSLKLRITEIEAEFEVAFARSGSAEVGFNFWTVLTAGGEAATEKSASHKLRIKLDAWLDSSPNAEPGAIGHGVDVDAPG